MIVFEEEKNVAKMK